MLQVDVTPSQTNVLLALLRVHQRDGRCDVSTVAAEAGRCKSTTFQRLKELRAVGLVAWEPKHIGTLRPLVAAVPFGWNRA